MEEKNPKNMNIKIEGIPGNADPSPVLTLIFATLCVCFWANTMGLLGDGAVLAIGTLQIAVWASYTIGGIILLTRGNGFGGNTFMIFATVFGGIGGCTHVGMTIAAHNGMPFDYSICGIAFIAAGVFLLAMVPVLLRGPLTDCIMFLFGGLGVLGYGLTGAGLAPEWLNYPAAWCLLIDGITGFYTVMATMYGFMGKPMSFGRPVLKEK